MNPTRQLSNSSSVATNTSSGNASEIAIVDIKFYYTESFFVKIGDVNGYFDGIIAELNQGISK